MNVWKTTAHNVMRIKMQMTAFHRDLRLSAPLALCSQCDAHFLATQYNVQYCTYSNLYVLYSRVVQTVAPEPNLAHWQNLFALLNKYSIRFNKKETNASRAMNTRVESRGVSSAATTVCKRQTRASDDKRVQCYNSFSF